MVRFVALIPARSGSKRVPGKNTRLLGGHSLLAYSIAAAKDAGLFDQIWVSTDTMRTVKIAQHYGAEGFLNDPERHTDTADDFPWIERLLRHLGPVEAFAILRPTSPFRLGSTIAAAWEAFQAAEADSLRAVRPVHEHPGKMWVERHGRLLPLLPFQGVRPWHSMPTQCLPPVFVQTSALEIAWTDKTIKRGTIAGEVVMPWRMSDAESLSIDTEAEWTEAERLLSTVPHPDPSMYDQTLVAR